MRRGAADQAEVLEQGGDAFGLDVDGGGVVPAAGEDDGVQIPVAAAEAGAQLGGRVAGRLAGQLELDPEGLALGLDQPAVHAVDVGPADLGREVFDEDGLVSDDESVGGQVLCGGLELGGHLLGGGGLDPRSGRLAGAGLAEGGGGGLEAVDPVLLARPDAGPQPGQGRVVVGVEGAGVQAEAQAHLGRLDDGQGVTRPVGPDGREAIPDQVEAGAGAQVDEGQRARAEVGAEQVGGPQPGHRTRGLVGLHRPLGEAAVHEVALGREGGEHGSAVDRHARGRLGRDGRPEGVGLPLLEGRGAQGGEQEQRALVGGLEAAAGPGGLEAPPQHGPLLRLGEQHEQLLQQAHVARHARPHHADPLGGVALEAGQADHHRASHAGRGPHLPPERLARSGHGEPTGDRPHGAVPGPPGQRRRHPDREAARAARSAHAACGGCPGDVWRSREAKKRLPSCSMR